MHFGDDETAKKNSGGIFAVSVCSRFKLQLDRRVQGVERKVADGKRRVILYGEEERRSSAEAAVFGIPLRW